MFSVKNNGGLRMGEDLPLSTKRKTRFSISVGVFIRETGFEKLGNFFPPINKQEFITTRVGANDRGKGMLGRGSKKKVDVTICQMQDGFFKVVLVHNQQIQVLSTSAQQQTWMNHLRNFCL